MNLRIIVLILSLSLPFTSFAAIDATVGEYTVHSSSSWLGEGWMTHAQFKASYPQTPAATTNGEFVTNSLALYSLSKLTSPQTVDGVSYQYQAYLIHFGSINSSGQCYIDRAQVYVNPVDQCSLLTGQVRYDLKQYDDPDQPPVSGNSCYEDCQQSSEILWNDCLAGSCVASVKYTATGQACGVETSVENLQTDPPDRCTDQINEKIAQCGGSLNVLSFDFETCTGECTPDACGDQWKELVDRCGGIMAVSTWDAQKCSGSCASDPVPNPDSPDSEAVPETVTEETKTNPDGTSEVTKTTIYNVDGDVYAETNTTTYDAEGNETGTTKSTTKGSGTTGTGTGTGNTQYFSAIQSSGFNTPYNPGVFDIPTRFNTFLSNVKSSGLFSFSTSFFNSLPGGGSPELTIDGGQTFGSHTFDFSQSLGSGLPILKSVLLALFGFLSIRAIIMKR